MDPNMCLKAKAVVCSIEQSSMNHDLTGRHIKADYKSFDFEAVTNARLSDNTNVHRSTREAPRTNNDLNSHHGYQYFYQNSQVINSRMIETNLKSVSKPESEYPTLRTQPCQVNGNLTIGNTSDQIHQPIIENYSPRRNTISRPAKESYSPERSPLTCQPITVNYSPWRTSSPFSHNYSPRRKPDILREPSPSKTNEKFIQSLRKYPDVLNASNSKEIVASMLSFTQKKHGIKTRHQKIPRNRYLLIKRPSNPIKSIHKVTKNINMKPRSSITTNRPRPSKVISKRSKNPQMPKSYSPVDYISLHYDYFKNLPQDSFRHWGKKRCVDVRYLSETTKMIKNKIKSLLESDVGAPCQSTCQRYSQHLQSCKGEKGAICEKMVNRYSQHLQICKKGDDDDERESPPEIKPLKKCSCGRKKSSIFKSDSKSIQTCPCSPIAKTIENIIKKFEQEIPVYPNETMKQKIERKKLVEELSEELIRLLSKKDMGTAKTVIKKYLDKMPMWLPEKDDKDEFKNDMADTLIEKIKQSAEVDLVELKKKVANLPYKMYKDVNTPINKSEEIDKLVDELLTIPKDDKEAMKKIIIELLSDAPLAVDPLKRDTFYEKTANELFSVLDTSEKEEALNEIVWYWVQETQPVANSGVNKKEANELSLKLVQHKNKLDLQKDKQEEVINEWLKDVYNSNSNIMNNHFNTKAVKKLTQDLTIKNKQAKRKLRLSCLNEYHPEVRLLNHDSKSSNLAGISLPKSDNQSCGMTDKISSDFIENQLPNIITDWVHSKPELTSVSTEKITTLIESLKYLVEKDYKLKNKITKTSAKWLINVFSRTNTQVDSEMISYLSEDLSDDIAHAKIVDINETKTKLKQKVHGVVLNWIDSVPQFKKSDEIIYNNIINNAVSNLIPNLALCVQKKCPDEMIEERIVEWMYPIIYKYNIYIDPKTRVDIVEELMHCLDEVDLNERDKISILVKNWIENSEELQEIDNDKIEKIKSNLNILIKKIERITASSCYTYEDIEDEIINWLEFTFKLNNLILSSESKQVLSQRLIRLLRRQEELDILVFDWLNEVICFVDIEKSVNIRFGCSFNKRSEKDVDINKVNLIDPISAISSNSSNELIDQAINEKRNKIFLQSKKTIQNHVHDWISNLPEFNINFDKQNIDKESVNLSEILNDLYVQDLDESAFSYEINEWLLLISKRYNVSLSDLARSSMTEKLVNKLKKEKFQTFCYNCSKDNFQIKSDFSAVQYIGIFNIVTKIAQWLATKLNIMIENGASEPQIKKEAMKHLDKLANRIGYSLNYNIKSEMANKLLIKFNEVAVDLPEWLKDILFPGINDTAIGTNIAIDSKICLNRMNDLQINFLDICDIKKDALSFINCILGRYFSSCRCKELLAEKMIRELKTKAFKNSENRTNSQNKKTCVCLENQERSSGKVLKENEPSELSKELTNNSRNKTSQEIRLAVATKTPNELYTIIKNEVPEFAEEFPKPTEALNKDLQENIIAPILSMIDRGASEANVVESFSNRLNNLLDDNNIKASRSQTDRIVDNFLVNKSLLRPSSTENEPIDIKNQNKSGQKLVLATKTPSKLHSIIKNELPEYAEEFPKLTKALNKELIDNIINPIQNMIEEGASELNVVKSFGQRLKNVLDDNSIEASKSQIERIVNESLLRSSSSDIIENNLQLKSILTDNIPTYSSKELAKKGKKYAGQSLALATNKPNELYALIKNEVPEFAEEFPKLTETLNKKLQDNIINPISNMLDQGASESNVLESFDKRLKNLLDDYNLKASKSQTDRIVDKFFDKTSTTDNESPHFSKELTNYLKNHSGRRLSLTAKRPSELYTLIKSEVPKFAQEFPEPTEALNKDLQDNIINPILNMIDRGASESSVLENFGGRLKNLFNDNNINASKSQTDRVVEKLLFRPSITENEPTGFSKQLKVKTKNTTGQSTTDEPIHLQKKLTEQLKNSGEKKLSVATKNPWELYRLIKNEIPEFAERFSNPTETLNKDLQENIIDPILNMIEKGAIESNVVESFEKRLKNLLDDYNLKASKSQTDRIVDTFLVRLNQPSTTDNESPYFSKESTNYLKNNSGRSLPLTTKRPSELYALIKSEVPKFAKEFPEPTEALNKELQENIVNPILDMIEKGASESNVIESFGKRLSNLLDDNNIKASKSQTGRIVDKFLVRPSVPDGTQNDDLSKPVRKRWKKGEIENPQYEEIKGLQAQEIKDIVENWLDSIPVSMSPNEKDDVLNSLTNYLSDKLNSYNQVPGVKITDKDEIDKIKNDVQKILQDNNVSNAVGAIQYVGDLITRINEAELEKKAISGTSKGGALDSLQKVINDWCDNLPLPIETSPEDMLKQKQLKDKVASKLMASVEKLNFNPAVFKDDYLYENELEKTIKDALDLLPSTTELHKKRFYLLQDLKDKLMSEREKLESEVEVQNFRKSMKDKIRENLPQKTAMTLDDLNVLEIALDNIADAFINMVFEPDPRQKYWNKQYFTDEVNEYLDYIMSYPGMCFIIEEVLNNTCETLCEYAKNATFNIIITELARIKIKEIINEWLKDLPINNELYSDDLLKINKMISILASRFHELESANDPNNYYDDMKNEVYNWLTQIPCVDDGAFRKYTDDLIERLIVSFEPRKKAIEQIILTLCFICEEEELNDCAYSVSSCKHGIKDKSLPCDNRKPCVGTQSYPAPVCCPESYSHYINECRSCGNNTLHSCKKIPKTCPQRSFIDRCPKYIMTCSAPNPKRNINTTISQMAVGTTRLSFRSPAVSTTSVPSRSSRTSSTVIDHNITRPRFSYTGIVSRSTSPIDLPIVPDCTIPHLHPCGSVSRSNKSDKCSPLSYRHLRFNSKNLGRPVFTLNQSKKDSVDGRRSFLSFYKTRLVNYSKWNQVDSRQSLNKNKCVNCSTQCRSKTLELNRFKGFIPKTKEGQLSAPYLNSNEMYFENPNQFDDNKAPAMHRRSSQTMKDISVDKMSQTCISDINYNTMGVGSCKIAFGSKFNPISKKGKDQNCSTRLFEEDNCCDDDDDEQDLFELAPPNVSPFTNNSLRKTVEHLERKCSISHAGNHRKGSYFQENNCAANKFRPTISSKRFNCQCSQEQNDSRIGCHKKTFDHVCADVNSRKCSHDCFSNGPRTMTDCCQKKKVKCCGRKKKGCCKNNAVDCDKCGRYTCPFPAKLYFRQ